MATITPTSNSASQAPGSSGGLRGLDMDHFLTLMITELQNQDPLNPMDNSQILQQISQIREIEATTSMQQTLEAVLLGQNLANASGLINKKVTGLTDSGDKVEGAVTSVSVADNKVQLSIGDQKISLSNVSEIIP